MSEKRCYTVQELQEILGVSRPTIYNLLKKKEFRWIQFLDDDRRKNAELFEETFYEKRIWIHRFMYSRKTIILLLLMKSIRNFWQRYWLIQRCGRCSIHWRRR